LRREKEFPGITVRNYNTRENVIYTIKQMQNSDYPIVLVGDINKEGKLQMDRNQILNSFRDAIVCDTHWNNGK
jgi:hypothetical protein